MSIEFALQEFEERGFVLIKNVYPRSLMEEIKEEFYSLEHIWLDIQGKKGLAEASADAAHHTPILCRKMLELLEKNGTSDFLESFFQPRKYILNTMGLSKIRPNGSVYTQNIHRDVRSFQGATQLWINSLIMLDDSTKENGATWIMEGSEKLDEQPTEEEFWAKAVQVEGTAGDVLMFHGGVWHRAGENNTEHTRHIITPFYSAPFIKQQLDYPRAFGPDFGSSCSAHLRQVLGYNSLVPTSLNDFYQQDADRFYKSDQG